MDEPVLSVTSDRHESHFVEAWTFRAGYYLEGLSLMRCESGRLPKSQTVNNEILKGREECQRIR